MVRTCVADDCARVGQPSGNHKFTFQGPSNKRERDILQRRVVKTYTGVYDFDLNLLFMKRYRTRCRVYVPLISRSQHPRAVVSHVTLTPGDHVVRRRGDCGDTLECVVRFISGT